MNDRFLNFKLLHFTEDIFSNRHAFKIIDKSSWAPTTLYNLEQFIDKLITSITTKPNQLVRSS